MSSFFMLNLTAPRRVIVGDIAIITPIYLVSKGLGQGFEAWADPEIRTEGENGWDIRRHDLVEDHIVRKMTKWRHDRKYASLTWFCLHRTSHGQL